MKSEAHVFFLCLTLVWLGRQADLQLTTFYCAGVRQAAALRQVGAFKQRILMKNPGLNFLACGEGATAGRLNCYGL